MVMKNLPQLSSPVNSISQVQHSHGCWRYLFYLELYYPLMQKLWLMLVWVNVNSQLSKIEKLSPDVYSLICCLCAQKTVRRHNQIAKAQ